MERNPYRLVLDDLRSTGWYQGDFYLDSDKASSSPACLWGAAYRSLSPDCIRDGVFTEPIATEDQNVVMLSVVKKAWSLFPDRRILSVVNLNDSDKTSFDDIELILEKCALEWDEKNAFQNAH